MPIPSDPSKVLTFTAKKYGDELVKEFPALFLSGEPQKFYFDPEFSFSDGVCPLLYVGTDTKWVSYIKKKDKYSAGICSYADGTLTIQIMKNPGNFKTQHEKALNVKYKTAFKVVEGTVAAAVEGNSSAKEEEDSISSLDQLSPAAKKVYDELNALLEKVEQLPDASTITDKTLLKEIQADFARIDELYAILEKEMA
jgi:hypothetical protein